LQHTPYLPAGAAHGLDWTIILTSTLFAVAGIGLACWRYGMAQTEQPAHALTPARSWWYELSANKFYLDDIYTVFIVAPLRGFAAVCRWIDQEIVDGLVDLTGHVPRLLGQVFRPVQNGLVQFYALAMLMGLTVFLVAMVYRWGG
jgi:NADH-quinone oxidoreductase subunit L